MVLMVTFPPLSSKALYHGNGVSRHPERVLAAGIRRCHFFVFRPYCRHCVILVSVVVPCLAEKLLAELISCIDYCNDILSVSDVMFRQQQQQPVVQKQSS